MTSTPMRTLVRDAITAAKADAHTPAGGTRKGFARLAGLTQPEVDALTDQILRTLADQPTPAPVLAHASAGPVLVVTAADVVARAAADALADQREDHTLGRDVAWDNPHGFIIEDWQPTASILAVRRLMWGIQKMFAAHAYSYSADGLAKICGTRAQVRAMRRVMETLIDVAAPMITGLDTEAQETFWATVAAMLTDGERARDLITENRETKAAAKGFMLRSLGRANDVGTMAAATEGRVRDLAAETVAAARSRGVDITA